jgi:hypothetical protein
MGLQVAALYQCALRLGLGLSEVVGVTERLDMQEVLMETRTESDEQRFPRPGDAWKLEVEYNAEPVHIAQEGEC